MKKEKTQMSQETYDMLLKELEKLQTVDRVEASEAIAIARQQGDLSENAEYDAAKDHQAQIEHQIRTLESKIANATIYKSANKKSQTVAYNNTVVLKDDKNNTLEVKIVGDDEIKLDDVKCPHISPKSPIGSAIFGKKLKDEVIVFLPDGSQKKWVISNIQA